MFRYLLIGYISIYCVFAIFLFTAYAWMVPNEDKITDKPWETPVDILLIAIGLAGMVFLLVDLPSLMVKAIWRPVSVALVGAQVFLCLKDRIQRFRTGEAKPGQLEATYANISAMLVLLPSLCLNVYFAFR